VVGAPDNWLHSRMDAGWWWQCARSCASNRQLSCCIAASNCDYLWSAEAALPVEQHSVCVSELSVMPVLKAAPILSIISNVQTSKSDINSPSSDGLYESN